MEELHLAFQILYKKGFNKVRWYIKSDVLLNADGDNEETIKLKFIKIVEKECKFK